VTIREERCVWRRAIYPHVIEHGLLWICESGLARPEYVFPVYRYLGPWDVEVCHFETLTVSGVPHV